MISTRLKILFVIMFWCIGSILILSNQAVGYQCSPEPTDDLILYGDTVTCEIDSIGDIDKFRFQGSNGDKAVVQASRQSGGSPCVELFDPDGSLIDSICAGSSARIDANLNKTGTYTILVTEAGNNQTMGYGLALERIISPSTSATPINPGEVLSDAIDPVGDMDLFFFQGSNGDKAVVQASRQSGGSPCVELFDPDGSLIDSICAGSSARIDANLDQSGIHAILVTEAGNNQTMGYGLALERITPPSASAKPIDSDDPLSDAIDPVGDMDLFFFQGSNGDKAVVQASRQSGGSPCVELFDPDGSLIDSICAGSSARIDADLDQSGIHAILVTEAGNNQTMGYGLSYQCIGVCPPPTLFADVPRSHWAYEDIMAIYDAGITTGCSENPLMYCPQDDVTRAQMAAFIVRAAEGEPADNYCGTGSPFSDVSPGYWACKYIKRLSELDITQGCGGDNYCPNDDVTRAQMAAFIVRAVEGEPPADYCDSGSPFSDVPSGHWACKYIKRLSVLGITQGCGGDKYCPNDNVTRAQMAAFLARAFLEMD